jgi:hypothetical protein
LDEKIMSAAALGWCKYQPIEFLRGFCSRNCGKYLTIVASAFNPMAYLAGNLCRISV